MNTFLKRTLNVVLFTGLVAISAPIFTKETIEPKQKTTISKKVKRALAVFDRAFFENEAGLAFTFIPFLAIATVLGVHGTIYSIEKSLEFLFSTGFIGIANSFTGAAVGLGLACSCALLTGVLLKATAGCIKSIPDAFQEAERHIQFLEDKETKNLSQN